MLFQPQKAKIERDGHLRQCWKAARSVPGLRVPGNQMHQKGAFSSQPAPAPICLQHCSSAWLVLPFCTQPKLQKQNQQPPLLHPQQSIPKNDNDNSQSSAHLTDLQSRHTLAFGSVTRQVASNWTSLMPYSHGGCMLGTDLHELQLIARIRGNTWKLFLASTKLEFSIVSSSVTKHPVKKAQPAPGITTSCKWGTWHADQLCLHLLFQHIIKTNYFHFFPDKATNIRRINGKLTTWNTFSARLVIIFPHKITW